MMDGIDPSADLPDDLRRREMLNIVEAVIFASPHPVSSAAIAAVIGSKDSIETLIEDLRHEIANRCYDIVRVAGGWQHRTRTRYSEAIRQAIATDKDHKPPQRPLGPGEIEALAMIAYMQPVTRGQMNATAAKEISRDTILRLRQRSLITQGPRSPDPGAPPTYITTDGFLAQFGLDTLQDLPDIDALREAGLMDASTTKALVDDEGPDLFQDKE
jgi:segregation and condensation protein B